MISKSNSDHLNLIESTAISESASLDRPAAALLLGIPESLPLLQLSGETSFDEETSEKR